MIDYSRIPESIREGLFLYVTHGYPQGGFLTAVLRNDLKSSMAHADEESHRSLRDIVSWIHSFAPAPCWGSKESVDAWVRMDHDERPYCGCTAEGLRKLDLDEGALSYEEVHRART